MLTPAELQLVADEIRELGADARLQKIGQPEPDRVLLRLFGGDVERNLLLVAGRPFPRAHFVDEAAPNPRTPPQFCEALRALLQPARLVEAGSLPRDRVLFLAFDVKTETAVVRRTLYAELFGSRPNLVLVAADKRILAVLDARPDDERPLRIDCVYREPEAPEADLAPRAPWSGFGDGFAPPSIGGGALSHALDDWFRPREAAARLDLERTALANDLTRSRRKLEKLVENLAADRRAIERIPELRAEGELLKAHLQSLKRGMKEATLDDWSSGAALPKRVVLDPTKTPLQNVSDRFEEARRLERSRETAEMRVGSAELKLEGLAAAEEALATCASREEVLKLKGELTKRGLVAVPPSAAKHATPKQEAAVEARRCYRVFTSADGIEILVGRTAKDNDELTFRVANGDDFWMHVRDYPGSHVVVRARPELPQETLLDAATLAVHFSRAEFAGKRDVSWTRRKRVQKSRGGPAGQVQLSEHKTLHLRCDPDRLKRLLGPERV